MQNGPWWYWDASALTASLCGGVERRERQTAVRVNPSCVCGASESSGEETAAGPGAVDSTAPMAEG